MPPDDRRFVTVVLLVACVLLSASIVKVNAQTTTISNLQYPSQVVLQNGVAQATITFTFGYSGLPPGDELLTEMEGQAMARESGSGSSTPDSCLSSWDGHVSLVGEPGCYIAPGSSSGTEAVTFTINLTPSPGQYNLYLATAMAESNSLALVSNSFNEQSVTITVVAGSAVPFDFTLALVPSTVTVAPGETATYQISISYSDPSYSGTQVQVQVSGLGQGMNYQVTPSPPTLSVTTSPSTPAGTYPIALVGSANGVSHEADATLVVQPAQQFDFSISASPSSQTVTPGGSTTFTVNVGLVSGSGESVALSLSGAPSGVSGSFNPPSGTPSFTSTLTVTVPSATSAGTFQLTVTGNGGGATHQATVTLIVSAAPDFQITVDPTSQSALQGEMTSYTVHVHGLNGFNSQVSLAVSGAPSGISPVFSTPAGTPDYDSTLTVPISATAPIGQVTLTVTATGGGVSHQVNLVLVINTATTSAAETTNSSSPAPATSLPSNIIGTLPPTTLLLTGVAVALAVLLIVMLLRRRPSEPAPTAPGTSERKEIIYCGQCGTQNPNTNQFCGKCGAKL